MLRIKEDQDDEVGVYEDDGVEIFENICKLKWLVGTV